MYVCNNSRPFPFFYVALSVLKYVGTTICRVLQIIRVFVLDFFDIIRTIFGFAFFHCQL